MESKYIITSDGRFLSDEEIYHWGIKGMKWGIRRYQNPDGSLTEKGKKRYTNPDGTLNKKGQKKFGNSVKDVMKKKSVKDMTDEELDRAIVRARKEDEYNRLHPEPQKKSSVLMNDVVKPAAVNAGRKLVSKLMDNAVEKLTGAKVDPDSYDYLKKYYDKLKVKKDINELLNPKTKELSIDDQIKLHNFERQKKREAEEDAKAAAKAANGNSTDNVAQTSAKRFKVKRIINDYSKKPVTAAYDADYEKRVDKILAEMDSRGWETYYRDYSNRRDDD